MRDEAASELVGAGAAKSGNKTVAIPPSKGAHQTNPTEALLLLGQML